MSNNIYKSMIEESPIAYIHLKFTESDIGEYINLEIKNYNKSFERIFIQEANRSIEDVIKLPESDEIRKRWQILFSKVKLNKKCVVTDYVPSVNTYFNIEVFDGGNNEFHLRLYKLNKQDRQLSSALKNAPFLAWIKDVNGIYVDINDAYLSKLGKTYDEVVGKTTFDILDKELAEYVTAEENKIIKQNKLLMYESDAPTNIDHLKGRYMAFKWPYMNEDESAILGTIGTLVDITESHNLKKSLQETEQRFLDIANNVNDIIVIQDDKKTHYINPAFEKIFGFKPDELYEDSSKWDDYWDEIEFEKEPIGYSHDEHDSCIFRVKKEPYGDVWIWSRSVPIFDDTGNISKRIGILSDITENKKLQLEIDKTKIDFFANLSHELRTPIHLILSSLQVLNLKLDQLDPQMYEYITKYLGIITQNGRRLLKLVNNLIDTTRLDAGCFEYNPRNRDIVSCIEGICESTLSFVNSNNLDIVFDTNKEEKIISFDPDNMERIMLNLISNAVKFSKPNGIIEITINCDKDVCITVKDSGIGIPKDKLDTIFGRFEQVKTNFKREREGSGIGLSLVKSLVEMHGGSVSVNSILNEGSEFIVTLPDILIEGDSLSEPITQFMSNENRLNVEFSDLYL